ncbi:DUF6879 family protein [Streptomyces sp. NPDC048606]|uniref:DUF6879 family protein n=1 Tax=Streptomyces sp. NPDC048606 TaxID=3154726 RepID=UPI00344817AB
MTQNVPDFTTMLRAAERSAVHLEMRDVYSVGDEVAEFEAFKRTGHVHLDPTAAWWPVWLGIVRETVGRGVVMRRARIVSEPVTDYIRWEHAATPLNIDAGEQVRWLSRRQASDIALPGNDFWLIDDTLVRWNHFTGVGDWDDPKYSVSDDPAVIKLCETAFETVWERGTPHAQYTV